MPSSGERNPSFDSDELTCCHRSVFCPSFLKNINLTTPLLGCICQQFTVGTFFWLTTVSMLIFLGYLCLYIQLGAVILPGGAAFGLFCVVIVAYLLGWAFAYIPYLNLPPVFGMLLAGIIARNTGWYDINEELGLRVSSKIRTFSVTFVLLRAGLQLTTSSLFEHPMFVLNLAIVPCTGELLTVAIFCKYVLAYTWGWAFLCGSIVACMSPVVPINCMLALADRGYGEDKELASMLFAAVSIDDIHIISVYAICYSFIFTHDERPKTWLAFIPAGFLEVIIGFLVGGLAGLFFTFFPHRSSEYVLEFRVIGLVLASLAMTTGAATFVITGGGFLSVIIMSYVSTTGWRILAGPYNLEIVNPLKKWVSIMWHWMQPVLVGVIGAEINLRNWSSLRMGYYCIILTFGLIVRTVLAFLATFHGPFTMKERIFIALSWISKGTLQAALGPLTMERAILDKNEEEIFFASDIERIAVLAIIILSPLGAIVMMSAGPHLLNKSNVEDLQRRRQLSMMKITSLQPVRKNSAQPR